MGSWGRWEVSRPCRFSAARRRRPQPRRPRPLLVIAGSKAGTLFWSREVYEKAGEPKELHVVEGATHIDLYDRPQFVTPAVGKLADFFGRHLAGVAAAGTEKKEEPA